MDLGLIYMLASFAATAASSIWLMVLVRRRVRRRTDQLEARSLAA